MKIDADRIVNFCNPKLPNGFSFRSYQADNIKHWSRIEVSVLKFDTEADANDFFQRAYMPYETELIKRCLFVLNSEGMPIATANA